MELKKTPSSFSSSGLGPPSCTKRLIYSSVQKKDTSTHTCAMTFLCSGKGDGSDSEPFACLTELCLYNKWGSEAFLFGIIFWVSRCCY